VRFCKTHTCQQWAHSNVRQNLFGVDSIAYSIDEILHIPIKVPVVIRRYLNPPSFVKVAHNNRLVQICDVRYSRPVWTSHTRSVCGRHDLNLCQLYSKRNSVVQDDTFHAKLISVPSDDWGLEFTRVSMATLISSLISSYPNNERNEQIRDIPWDFWVSWLA